MFRAKLIPEICEKSRRLNLNMLYAILLYFRRKFHLRPSICLLAPRLSINVFAFGLSYFKETAKFS